MKVCCLDSPSSLALTDPTEPQDIAVSLEWGHLSASALRPGESDIAVTLLLLTSGLPQRDDEKGQ